MTISYITCSLTIAFLCFIITKINHRIIKFAILIGLASFSTLACILYVDSSDFSWFYWVKYYTIFMTALFACAGNWLCRYLHNRTITAICYLFLLLNVIEALLVNIIDPNTLIAVCTLVLLTHIVGSYLLTNPASRSTDLVYVQISTPIVFSVAVWHSAFMFNSFPAYAVQQMPIMLISIGFFIFVKKEIWGAVRAQSLFVSMALMDILYIANVTYFQRTFVPAPEISKYTDIITLLALVWCTGLIILELFPLLRTRLLDTNNHTSAGIET